MTEVNLFIGPTLEMATPIELPDYFCRHAPIQQDDIHHLMESNVVPGVIVVVDGYIEHEFSVAHSELCLALSLGWQIYGLSDMGAIRAFELRDQGMRGYGQVYRSLVDDKNLSDDEILWDYNMEKPYSINSEPLIHMREALTALVSTDRISSSTSQIVLGILKQQWYKKRTLNLFLELVRQHGHSISRSETDSLKDNFNQFRIKCCDFDRFMLEQPWHQHLKP